MDTAMLFALCEIINKIDFFAYLLVDLALPSSVCRITNCHLCVCVSVSCHAGQSFCL